MTLQGIKDRKAYRQLDFFEPYAKQRQFIKLTSTKREAALIAGNQVGKTHVGGFMAACHLTGLYPDWWDGRRWDRPVRAWMASPTGMMTRDGGQKKLCGEPGVKEMFGTGFIPKERFIGQPSRTRGVTDAWDTLQVRHNSGGISVLKFKSYEQGREKFQSETLDFVWCDEEPDAKIYGEILTRIAATDGMVYCTFTPLLGRSEVVLRYVERPSKDRGMVNMTDEEAGHITAEMRAKNRAGWASYEVEARSRGVPLLGSGRVYEIGEEAITEPRLEYVPEEWAKLWCIDFGLGRRFAADLLLWDRDNDVIHVHAALDFEQNGSIYHAAAMRLVGAEVPVAWPHDGNAKDKGSGEPLAEIYKAHGLRMLPEHATHSTGGYAVEAGIRELDERMKSGRFKVARHLQNWFEQFRFYHRKDGVIVKERDHHMDATRTGIMMKRSAKPVGLGMTTTKRQTSFTCSGLDFDLF